jgi:hypothetical protein
MTLTPWQRANILAALNYLQEIGRIGQNPKAQALAEGLAEPAAIVDRAGVGAPILISLTV